MNKYLKYALIILGVIAFIELQVLMFFTISNSINKNDIPNNINTSFEKGNRNTQGTMQEGSVPQGEMPSGNMGGDISDSAVTPGSDDNSSTSSTSSSSGKKTKTTTETSA